VSSDATKSPPSIPLLPKNTSSVSQPRFSSVDNADDPAVSVPWIRHDGPDGADLNLVSNFIIQRTVILGPFYIP